MRRLSRNGPWVLVLVGLIAAWQAYGRLRGVPQYVLPAPTDVARALWDERSPLASAAAVTAREMLAGFAVALAFGFGAAVVLLVASSAQTPRIVAASAPAGSHSVAAMLAMAAARVRVPTVGQLPARRRIVRPSARAHRPRPVHHASTAPAVQVAAVSHRSTGASTAPSSAASYGGQGSGGSSYVLPPATSNAQAATSTPPPSAASQSQPAGPTGPGAILGPGHCSC